MIRQLLSTLIIFFTLPAQAADISIAFTNEKVDVDTGFHGAQVTLFGAVTGIEDLENSVDIISVVRGPSTDFEVRRLEKSALIWTPGASRKIEQAPGLFHTYATRQVSDIATLPLQARHELQANFLNLELSSREEPAPEATHEHFREAFLEETEKLGLYHASTEGVTFIKGALFTIKIDLPANTPVGDYNVSVFLFRDGALLAQDDATLAVKKVGAERRIYEFAHDRPVLYGIFCVIISLLAGWLASVAFRKR